MAEAVAQMSEFLLCPIQQMTSPVEMRAQQNQAHKHHGDPGAGNAWYRQHQAGRQRQETERYSHNLAHWSDLSIRFVNPFCGRA
jgi:hypothetical protein